MGSAIKGGGSAPPVPDAAATAAAAGASNINTAIAQSRLNMVNQRNPYGSLTYRQTGTKLVGTGKDAHRVPIYTSTVRLSPAQQRLLNQQNALSGGVMGLGQGQLGRIGDAIGHPIDFSGLPAAPTGNEADRQRVEDALYARQTARLDPQYQKQQTDLETQLVNSGFSRGSAGYRTALDDYSRQRDDAYAAARNDAIAGGGSEQSRLFGLESTARANAEQEYMAQRNAPINELAALLGTGGGVQVPQFSPPPQTAVNGVDVAGLIGQQYNAQNANYQNQQAQSNSLMGSLFGLGGAALGAWL